MRRFTTGRLRRWKGWLPLACVACIALLAASTVWEVRWWWGGEMFVLEGGSVSSVRYFGSEPDAPTVSGSHSRVPSFSLRWRDEYMPRRWAHTFAYGITINWRWAVVVLAGCLLYAMGYRRGKRVGGRANPDACRRCGYPLETTTAAATEAAEGHRTCPECGTRNPPAAPAPAPPVPGSSCRVPSSE